MPYQPETVEAIDPALVIAAARCYAARWRRRPTSQHPRRCGLCRKPAPELRDLMDDFRTWVGTVEGKAAQKAWDALGRAAQEDRIAAYA